MATNSLALVSCFQFGRLIMDRIWTHARNLGREYGDVISVDDLRKILRKKSCKTIYAWIAAGRLDGCYRKRGKHHLIIREAALKKIFLGSDWTG